MFLITIKLLNFMDIKKPQLGKVEAFARMGQLFRGVLQHPRVCSSPRKQHPTMRMSDTPHAIQNRLSASFIGFK